LPCSDANSSFVVPTFVTEFKSLHSVFVKFNCNATWISSDQYLSLHCLHCFFRNFFRRVSATSFHSGSPSSVSGIASCESEITRTYTNLPNRTINASGENIKSCKVHQPDISYQRDWFHFDRMTGGV
jgi:hypothetical protein